MPSDPILMCVVGGPKVGKTSLIKCLTGSSAMVGADGSAMVSQWDTVITDSHSQQRFRIWELCGAVCTDPFAQLYYSQCEIIVIAYSITSAASYEFAQTLWRSIRTATIRSPTLEVLFVGLKSDMEEEREVSIPDARQFALSNQFHFYEVSVLVGTSLQRMKSDVITLLSTTEAQRVSGMIQACSLHLEYRKLKASEETRKETLERIQDLLRRNQYDVLYYNYTEDQLEEEVKKLEARYLEVMFQNPEDEYRCFVS